MIREHSNKQSFLFTKSQELIMKHNRFVSFDHSKRTTKRNKLIVNARKRSIIDSFVDLIEYFDKRISTIVDVTKTIFERRFKFASFQLTKTLFQKWFDYIIKHISNHSKEMTFKQRNIKESFESFTFNDHSTFIILNKHFVKINYLRFRYFDSFLLFHLSSSSWLHNFV